MADEVFAERDGSIATVVLNRPDKLNAMDKTSWILLDGIMAELDAQDDVRCIVVRGVDGRAFSAGSDISAWSEQRTTREDVRDYSKTLEDSVHTVFSCRHPVIAAINGVCMGGGLLIASVCDIRICGESSRFGVPINRLGMTVSYAELGALSRIVSSSAALEILLEGNVFGAAHAKELGLVNHIVSDADVEHEAQSLAQKISERAPLVNRWHKRFVHRLQDPTPLTEEEIEEGHAAFDTEDYQTGYRAFLQKTKPKFEGR
jgi:enoyl-CoA hydratase/carnithine racemase